MLSCTLWKLSWASGRTLSPTNWRWRPWTSVGACCPALDVNGACAGFVYALDLADAYLKSGKAGRVLIVCAEAMSRIAQVSAKVAQIQQDNLLDVHNWVDRNRIRLMEMEWIDGYDLSRLLTRKMLEWVHARVSERRWRYINEVIVTTGPVQPRLKPGIAIAIIRDCLAALAALHREGIVHGDLKPANIMLKRIGNAKIVDIGSAFELDNVPARRTCTPAYAAPEVLEGGECSPRSDLASLGYVLVEMLAGVPPFEGRTSYNELLEAKRFLAQRLPHLLPEEVVCNELLMNFCRGLIAPDPMRRFPSAEDADLRMEGAAGFHRQLILGGLASEYENEIRLWLEELHDSHFE